MKNLTKTVPLVVAMLMAAPLTANAHESNFSSKHTGDYVQHERKGDHRWNRDHKVKYQQDRFIERFNSRLDRQLHAIKKGKRSGELTHKEAKRLKEQHRKVARLADRFYADGWYSYKERNKLKNRLNGISEKIQRLKNNDRYADKKHMSRRYL